MDVQRQPAGRTARRIGWNLGMFADVLGPREQTFRSAPGLGSGRAARSLATGFRLPVERRHADDRGKPRFQRHGRWAFRGLQRADWREIVGDGDRHRRRCGPATYVVDGKSSCRSRSAGAGSSAFHSERRIVRRRAPCIRLRSAARPRCRSSWYRLDALVAGVKYDPANVQPGTTLYVNNCVFCHGVPGVDRGGNIS